MNEEKECKICGVTKPLGLFTKNKTARSGYGARCLQCERIRSRNKRKKSPQSAKATQLKLKYGITGNVYDFLLKGQDYLCRICHKTPEENGKDLSVDHDHSTGDIRGLLCQKCNTGLGMFEDDPILLESAVVYLTESYTK